MDIFPWIAIAAYLIGTLVVGLWGYRAQKNTVEDYFLANRNIGSLLMFFTLASTNFSAFFFLGFAGAGYRIGLSYYPMMAFGTGFAALSFYYIGYPAWKLGQEKGLITPAELIADRIPSQPLKLLFLAVMVLFTLPYLTLQPIGAGYLLESLTGGAIPYFWGATLLTVAIVFYVWIGGMRSVALTDLLQGILMFSLMLVALFAIAHGLGGISAANEAIFQLKPELFSRQGAGDFFKPKVWLSFMFLWSFTLPMFPQMFMRFYSAKTPASLKSSMMLYPIVAGILFICPVAIGMWGHLAFPDLVGKAADQIFPMMLTKYTSSWLASLVMVGALAAFMSTLDSQLLALSSMLTRDIYTTYIRKDATLAEQTLGGPTLHCRPSFDRITHCLKSTGYDFGLCDSSLYWPIGSFPDGDCRDLWSSDFSLKLHSFDCGWGTCGVLGIQFEWIPKSLMLGFLPVVPIVAIASLIIVVGTLIENALRTQATA